MSETISFSPESETIDFESIKQQAIERVLSFEQERFYMDRGGAAKVYELPRGFCIKIMESRHNNPHRDLMDLGNSVMVEARLLERASFTDWRGSARVPRYFGVISDETPEGTNAIIMERLNAANLQHILNGTDEFPEVFTIESFFEELESFVQHLQDKEHIAHKDLEPRNIMVDRKTGAPRVIDFGRSTLLTSFTDPLKRKAEEMADWDKLEEVYDKTKLYIERK